MPRGTQAKYMRRMKKELTSDSNKKQRRAKIKDLQHNNNGKRITRKNISENKIELEDYLNVLNEMSKMANTQSDKEADRFCKKLGQELEF